MVHDDDAQTPPTLIQQYDPNGNLVFDGACIYQYDAWGRLLQVNHKGSAVLGPDGRIESGLLGDVKLRYAYDGLGRLIRKETPMTSGRTAFQQKDIYYDGVRRIQEVIFRPFVVGLGVSAPLTTETPEGEEVVDVVSSQNDEVALTLQDVLPEGDPQLPPESQSITVLNPIGSFGLDWTDREYVYGPGYIDEFVAQIDRDGHVIYVLQDANYNVVALMGGLQAVVPDVLAQYTYEPYGELVAVDSFGTHAINRIGHQGLFFDRFDGGIHDPVLAPGAAGLYYNRNRMYSPSMGRFIQ
ncbi:MAG: hypothetical protein MI923_01180, partial [Phycisphaerales bacterium]|nr:hypothetical protein [Phycisphaerales bacterium]